MSRRTALAALLALAATWPAGAQSLTFSARTEAVRVDVLVTQNGHPVKGLGAADFEVLDNGVPQEVDMASFEQVPLDLVLVFDMSGSVAGERLEQLRTAGRALLDVLNPQDQAALITFSQVVNLSSPLTQAVGRVAAALDRAEASGDTALIDASYVGMIVGESDVGRALVILFSDGVDTSSWLTSETVLDSARRTDAVVYGIAVSSPRSSFLRDLTALTGGSLISVESTKDLGSVFLGILEEFRQRYLVSYSPRGVAPNGWHEIDVRVKARGATVKARPGYLAGP